MSSADDPHMRPDSVRVASLKNNNLSLRVQTAVIGGLICLAAILATSEIPIYILTFAVAYFAAIEVKEVFGGTTKPIAVFSVVAATTIVYILSKFMAAPFAALIAVLIGTVGLILRIRRNGPHMLDVLALGWIAGPLACTLWLHNESADSTRFFSPNLLALVALPLWLGDAAAYFIGKRFGKNLLAPKVSPNKTIEGAIANLITAVASSLIIGSILNKNLIEPIPTSALLAVGVILGTLGQIGDLLESALKRSAGVKDSGSILPGHGGILDRIDSFLFASVPASIVLWILAHNSFPK